ncbi:hypothetical protein C8R43DRAFT_1136728 [Mycena crocata]|nr:hypothetical protein C8R43DRAFT_1136728 [Mycena crocata]
MTPQQRYTARRLIGQSTDTGVAGVSRRAPPSAGVTRVRSHAERERRMRIQQGTRVVRLAPLTVTALYVDGVLPPVLTTNRPHQKCRLCSHVKAHPVSYLCGHSHCYSCIRLHLETDWRCPDCDTIMDRPPHRHDGEETGIQLDYPNWGDTSSVLYSFDGLTFPKPLMYRTSYNLDPADDSN